MRYVLFVPLCLYAAVFGSLRGIVHDPDHRPVAGAHISIQSTTSDYSQTATTDADGAFEVASVPVGSYRVTATRDGFEPLSQDVVVVSGSAPMLHFPLA